MQNNKKKSKHNIEDYENLEFFQSLPKSLTKVINNLGSIQYYYPGEIVINQGMPCKSTYLILHGYVNVFTTAYNGRIFVLAKLNPGDWFNAITCLNYTENNPSSVRAEAPLTLLSLTCQNFLKVYEDEPLFALRVMQNISNRAIHLTSKLENLAFLTVSGRLADFIINHANEEGVIYWQCTQNDIAKRIGTVAEVVGRTLRQFADEGLIILHGNNCIVIKDLEGLRQKSLY
jgi:CRP/FNR family transcriptional regulator